MIEEVREDVPCWDPVHCLIMVNNHTCQSTDNINKLERALFIYLYPIIAAVCIIGNTANLVVYNHPYLRSSTTIRMLAVKAVANTLNIVSLLPMHISSLVLLSATSHDIPPAFYWFSLQHVLFFANLFSTIAIWLTAAVSIENCLLVVFPVQAKLWCTMRNAWTVICLCSIFALVLHAFNLICREVTAIWCFDSVTSNISQTYSFQIVDGYSDVEGIYYWCSGLSTIVIPMLVMLAATLLIHYHLVWIRSSSTLNSTEISRSSRQKRCVVRLSFVTALCHIFLEMPHLVILVIAAKRGSTQDIIETGWPTGTDSLITISNFLAQLNASIPFLVYFLCSKRFRQLCMITIGGMTSMSTFSVTAPFTTSRASMSHRRSTVVLFNNNHSRASVPATFPLSTFPTKDNRRRSSRRNTTSADTVDSLAPPSITRSRPSYRAQYGRNEDNHRRLSVPAPRMPPENDGLLVRKEWL